MYSSELNIRDTYENEALFEERIKQLINNLLLPENSNKLLRTKYASEYLYLFKEEYEFIFCEILIYLNKLGEIVMICNGASIIKKNTTVFDEVKKLVNKYNKTIKVIVNR